MPTRRQILSAAGALLMPAMPALGTPLEAAAPAEAGFRPDLPQRLAAAEAAGKMDGVHAIVLLRGGRIVLERYYPGEDEAWGRPLGRVAFGPGTLHDLRSVTKSIVGLLYGIALAAGRVPDLDAPVTGQFREYPDLAQDPGLARIAIRHLLTMTMGTEWNEDLPYADATNSEIAMEMAPDRYRFVLSRPVVEEPGRRWNYNGGATALLGRIVARGTGEALPDFARSVLFDPLGIGATEWARGADGEPSAASGLRMTPRDLARVGRMILAGGNGVVPASWLEASFRPAVQLPDGRLYGLHWYLGRMAAHRWMAAVGNGGQRLFVLPDSGVVLAMTAGRYNQPGQEQPSLALLREVVLPALAG